MITINSCGADWTLIIYPEEFFPCSVGRMRKLLKIIDMSTDPEGILMDIQRHLKDMSVLFSVNYSCRKLVEKYEKLLDMTRKELEKWVDL